MSTRLYSETQFYSDFEPLTNPQLIKKTLYVDMKLRSKGLTTYIHLPQISILLLPVANN